MWGCLAARAEKTSPRLLRDLLMEQASFWCLPSTCDLASLSLHPQANTFLLGATCTVLLAHLCAKQQGFGLFLFKTDGQAFCRE